MAKIVIIGAGSGFGGRISMDILSRPALQDSTIALCDLDETKLNAVAGYVRRAIAHHNLKATVVTSTDRVELLKGADFVMTAVSVGGGAYDSKIYRAERHIPAKYGVHQSVADTLGVGGVFRFLRTAGVQLSFCRDIEKHCPRAILINYTNPMAMLCWLHSAATSVQNVGLCHSVQHTMKTLCQFVGVPYEESNYWVAGINHQSWVLDFRHNGVDMYDALRKAMKKKAVYDKDAVRFEIMKNFGYFVTESSMHNSEYVPYFRRTLELREKYRVLHRHKHGRRSQARKLEKMKQRRQWLITYADESAAPIPELKQSDEYASGIIEGVVTNTAFKFNGNVTNRGLITNLPAGCSVEVPCIADGQGIHPCHVGDLPAQCAALNRSNIAVQELAVKAVLEKNPEYAFYACAVDPLTAACATLDDIRKMFKELWRVEKQYLTYFDE